ncbi:MAG: hypothetical protein NE330_13230 [Lentisphaeraceae bacterium]|nr:hypothetical protein [Lentisphaeraceae bacterium]
MLRIILGLIFFTITSSAKDFEYYKKIYTTQKESIDKDYSKSLVTLLDKYSKTLDKYLITIQKTGNLDNATAVQSEIERFFKNKEIPQKASQNNILNRIQTPFIAENLKIYTRKVTKLRSLVGKYSKTLTYLQKKLVIAGDLEKAKKVQKERQELKIPENKVIANTKVKPKYTESQLKEGVVLLPEIVTDVKTEDDRIQKFEIETPFIKFGRIEIIVKIKHTYDDSGDKGMTYKLMSGSRTVKKGFFSSRDWKEFTYTARSHEKLVFILEDKDTSFTKGAPGNGCSIEIKCRKAK